MAEIDAARLHLIAALRDLTIDELIVGLRLALCDTHCRALAVGLVFPVINGCEHKHDIDCDIESIEMATEFVKSTLKEMDHGKDEGKH